MRHNPEEARHLSANALAELDRQRDALAALVEERVVPLLEALVQQDYPLRRTPGSAAAAPAPGAGSIASGWLGSEEQGDVVSSSAKVWP